MNVLIIENEQFLEENLCRLISDHGEIRIEHASSVRNALDVLNKRTFDLVLSDIQLPDAPDDEWSLKVGAISPGQKVIVMSSSAIPAAIKAAESLNIIGYFEKPFDVNLLISLLNI